LRQRGLGEEVLLKALAVLTLILLSLLTLPGAGAAGYQDGLAPPAPPGGFPAPSRKVAGIVTDIWRDEHSTSQKYLKFSDQAIWLSLSVG
jgi:hypothetical protein